MDDREMARAVQEAAARIRPAKQLLERFVELPGPAVVRVDDFAAALVDVATHAGYVVMGAQRFDDDRPGVALFHRGQPREWSVYELCSGDWRAAWDRHRDRVPDELPRALRTTPVAQAPVPAFPGYELRCVRVQALKQGAPARFRAGRPVHERA